ncbi:hypothetical protein [Streptomyces sp. NPDC047079]
MGPLADYLRSTWAPKLDTLADLAEAAERAEREGAGDSEGESP